jgi:hypothetical protein
MFRKHNRIKIYGMISVFSFFLFFISGCLFPGNQESLSATSTQTDIPKTATATHTTQPSATSTIRPMNTPTFTPTPISLSPDSPWLMCVKYQHNRENANLQIFDVNGNTISDLTIKMMYKYELDPLDIIFSRNNTHIAFGVDDGNDNYQYEPLTTPLFNQKIGNDAKINRIKLQPSPFQGEDVGKALQMGNLKIDSKNYH